MKKPTQVDDLASRLARAAVTPPIPPRAPETLFMPTISAELVKQEKIKRPPADTMQLTLRPSRALHARYLAVAAERSRTTGRVVSVQEVMLDVLERAEP